MKFMNQPQLCLRTFALAAIALVSIYSSLAKDAALNYPHRQASPMPPASSPRRP